MGQMAKNLKEGREFARRLANNYQDLSLECQKFVAESEELTQTVCDLAHKFPNESKTWLSRASGLEEEALRESSKHEATAKRALEADTDTPKKRTKVNRGGGVEFEREQRTLMNIDPKESIGKQPNGSAVVPGPTSRQEIPKETAQNVCEVVKNGAITSGPASEEEGQSGHIAPAHGPGNCPSMTQSDRSRDVPASEEEGHSDHLTPVHGHANRPSATQSYRFSKHDNHVPTTGASDDEHTHRSQSTIKTTQNLSKVVDNKVTRSGPVNEDEGYSNQFAPAHGFANGPSMTQSDRFHEHENHVPVTETADDEHTQRSKSTDDAIASTSSSNATPSTEMVLYNKSRFSYGLDRVNSS